jgi:hypothetical protein
MREDKTNKYPRYVWAVVPKYFKGCLDIRRYAFSYTQAIEQLKHCGRNKGAYKDCATEGVWTLFKLKKLNKRGYGKGEK